MDKENKNQTSGKAKESLEHELLLQWGNRKRLRCVRVKDPDISRKFKGGVRMKITSQFLVTSSRNSEGNAVKVNSDDKHKYPSPEKEEKCYTRREMESLEGNGKGGVDLNGNGGGEGIDSGFIWPKLYITLSSKEKEEDFLAMKGCKPPQRPKKRAKIIQRSLLLVTPGAWLTDMSQERYEVREKKGSKKRTRGLKSMGGGSVETGSE